MRDMADDITNSDTLIPYLVASDIINGEVCIALLHSIKWYSARFGGSNALHSKTLVLLREMVDTQQPPLIRCNQDPDEDLVEEVRVHQML
jgi:hypothetical protein